MLNDLLFSELNLCGLLAMENQKFCLTWKDYNTNFCKEFGEFRKHEDFFDVTLACEDNTITAHKLVLSASSDFFKTILRKHKHEHPLIYLTEVKFSDLQSILDFIYTGEAEVAEKDLESLLSTATRFKVKGLTDGIGGTGIGTEAVTMTTGVVVPGEPIRKKIKTDIVLEEKRPKILSPCAPVRARKHKVFQTRTIKRPRCSLTE